MASQTYQLLMRSGPTPGKIFELNQNEMTIGRDVLNAIAINDPEISRRHALLALQPGGYMIEDLGSTNGTFVNGQRLMGPHLLRPGELVLLGETVSLVYEALEFDPNATLVSSAGEQPQAYRPPSYQGPPVQEYAQPIPQARPAQSAYSGQIPPVQPSAYIYPQEEERRPSRTWLWAGLGCLVVLLCGCVAAAYAFDSLNLYCTAPFNSLTDFFGYYCP